MMSAFDIIRFINFNIYIYNLRPSAHRAIKGEVNILLTIHDKLDLVMQLVFLNM